MGVCQIDAVIRNRRKSKIETLPSIFCIWEHSSSRCSSALVSSNIRNGVWIFGVLGNFTGWVDNQSASYWANITFYDNWHGSRLMWCD